MAGQSYRQTDRGRLACRASPEQVLQFSQDCDFAVLAAALRVGDYICVGTGFPPRADAQNTFSVRTISGAGRNQQPPDGGQGNRAKPTATLTGQPFVGRSEVPWYWPGCAGGANNINKRLSRGLFGEYSAGVGLQILGAQGWWTHRCTACDTSGFFTGIRRRPRKRRADVLLDALVEPLLRPAGGRRHQSMRLWRTGPSGFRCCRVFEPEALRLLPASDSASIGVILGGGTDGIKAITAAVSLRMFQPRGPRRFLIRRATVLFGALLREPGNLAGTLFRVGSSIRTLVSPARHALTVI